MPTFATEQLIKVTVRIFEAVGATDYEAKCVAEHLVESNLIGHDSHGIILIPDYYKVIKEGKIRPKTKIKIIHETNDSALVDGNWGFGQVAAKEAMEIAIKKAKTSAISAVGLFHVYHIGMLGYYSMMAAEQDLIGIVMCNSAPIMSPYGGFSRLLGTNPISVAIPAGKWKPFLMDFATSVVAAGKVRVALNRGEKIPYGWILDKEGRPTDNPADLYEGGVLLPFGGYKGYTLALLVDILSGALTGHGCSSSPEYETGNGTFMIVINPANFTPLEAFKKRVDELFQTIKSSPTAPGVNEIFIPGELEFRTKEKRLKEGIPVDEKTWQSIEIVAKELGLDINKIVKDVHD
jgi:uncharacterized oxidoreductase